MSAAVRISVKGFCNILLPMVHFTLLSPFLSQAGGPPGKAAGGQFSTKVAPVCTQPVSKESQTLSSLLT